VRRPSDDLAGLETGEGTVVGRDARSESVKWSLPKSAGGAKIDSNSPRTEDHLVRRRPAVRVRPWAPSLFQCEAADDKVEWRFSATQLGTIIHSKVGDMLVTVARTSNRTPAFWRRPSRRNIREDHTQQSSCSHLPNALHEALICFVQVAKMKGPGVRALK
jgi:hypothetical protein